MGLDNFGTAVDAQQAEEFGRGLIEKYGVEACEEAAVLDEAPISDGTATSYKPQVRQVISKLEPNPSVSNVVDAIIDSDKSSSTKNVMVMAMRKYYVEKGERDKSQSLQEQMKRNDMAEVDFSQEMQVENWITKEEVERIEEHILPAKGSRANNISGVETTYSISLEHKALLMTLFYTGCRVGEICRQNSDDVALSLDDLYWDDGEAMLYRLKKKDSGYTRDMKVLPNKLWDVLDEYLEVYEPQERPDNPDGHIFPFTTRTAQNRIKDVGQCYNFMFGEFDHTDRLTPHKFRHGRVTDLANNSSLDDAGEYVEHASRDTTMKYRHTSTERQKEILPEDTS